MTHTVDSPLPAVRSARASTLSQALFSATFAIAVTLTGGASIAQDAAPVVPVVAPIPVSVKTGTSPTASDISAINEFVSAEATMLASEDPQVQSQAREALVTAARVDGSASKSSSDYLWEYTGAIDKALFPLSRNPFMRVRLNVAIVLARVSADAPGQSSKLQRTVEAMLAQETDPAVVLWVLKAVQPIISQSLLNPKQQFPNANPLVDAVVTKAAKFPSGPIAEEAYAGITLNWQARAKQIVPPIYQTVIPEVQKLMRTRLEKYKTGAPDEPMLDANYGLLFLTHGSVLPLQSRAQKIETVQLLHDLTALAANRAAALPAKGGREDLIPLLQLLFKYLQTVAEKENSPQSVAAMKGLSQLSSNSDSKVIAEAARSALAALRSIPTLSELAPAPVASNAATSTSP